nr:hypothetical protein [Bradyrhizobium sp. SRL28]
MHKDESSLGKVLQQATEIGGVVANVTELHHAATGQITGVQLNR